MNMRKLFEAVRDSVSLIGRVVSKEGLYGTIVRETGTNKVEVEWQDGSKSVENVSNLRILESDRRRVYSKDEFELLKKKGWADYNAAGKPVVRDKDGNWIEVRIIREDISDNGRDKEKFRKAYVKFSEGIEELSEALPKDVLEWFWPKIYSLKEKLVKELVARKLL